MLLGSFGTFAILLFGRPEADAVRLWPLLGGQLGATAIAMVIIQLFGANLLSRAAAMAATVVYMMWSDTIHPPGGERRGPRQAGVCRRALTAEQSLAYLFGSHGSLDVSTWLAMIVCKLAAPRALVVAAQTQARWSRHAVAWC